MINKILKFVQKPTVLTFFWLSFFFSPALGLVRNYYIKNGGILGLHLRGLPTILYYTPYIIATLVFLIFIIWYTGYLPKNVSKQHSNLLWLSTTLNLIFLLSAFIVINIEYQNYPNYIFEHYGISVSQIEYLTLISGLQITSVAGVFLLGLNKKNVNNKHRDLKVPIKENIDKISITFVVIGISIFVLLSARTFIKLPYYIKESRVNYESKIGPYYKYLDLLAKYTPTDIVVIHPPQSEKWHEIGSQPIIRYFLFPRILVSGALFTNQKFTLNFDTAYFIEIDANIPNKRWPLIDVKNKVIIFDEKNEISYKQLEIDSEHQGIRIYKINF